MNRGMDTTKTEIQAHFNKALEKIRAAEDLIKTHHIEDASSRLYYALFHAIGACLKWKNIDLHTHKHVYILNRFKEQFIQTKIFEQSIMDLVIYLKSLRESADYGINDTFDQDEFQEALDEVKRTIQRMEKELMKRK